ncbi:MAG: hypothetical protein KBI35_08885 [Ruminococcus sp.]|jgi:hypothetical protein|nr:hypothetical protein [Ruminococcus sp.]MBP8594513.1 hypothetical protein [Ruminococcus sp.]MBQ8122162.1 hypothetical protein [Ruminococcus sp.]HOO06628.1 hypothetical protein [Ruminococcus sp.]
MDIKKIIEDLIAKIKNDKDFGSKFKSDPVKTVEGAVGVDLPDDKINEIIEAVKAKINLDDAAGGIKGLLNKLKG